MAITMRCFPFILAALILIMGGPSPLVTPVEAGIGKGDSESTIIDTAPPILVVDQFPPFTIFLGGETVVFHWQSGDDHPSQIPEDYTAMVWIDDQIEATHIYYPEIEDHTWEWTAVEVSSANVYLEVKARDAFGNLTSEVTNNFTILESVTDVPPGSRMLGLSSPAPNPFNPSTTLSFHLPEPGMVDLAVYDARGHLVRSLAHGPWQAGDFSLQWDGRDDRERSLPGGVYLFVLDFTGSEHSGRFTRKAVLVP